MSTIPSQLIDDFSDQRPGYVPWPVRLKSRWGRGIWWGILTICPLAMIVLGIVFAQPPRGTFNPAIPAWPAGTVTILACAHLALSVACLVTAFWVWGRREWWLGWLVVFLASGPAYLVTFVASMATTGFYP